MKVKGESPVVGHWDWEDYSVLLLTSGDVVLNDNKNEKSMMIFFTDRSKNTPAMNTVGYQHRMYMIKEFMSWENLDQLDNAQDN